MKRFLNVQHISIPDALGVTVGLPRTVIPNENLYPNTLLSESISIDNVKDAARILYSFLVQNKKYMLDFDMDELEKTYTPRKKMTLSEIEEILGYSIELVEEEAHTDNE